MIKMDKPLNYEAPSMYRILIDEASNPELHLPTGKIKNILFSHVIGLRFL